MPVNENSCCMLYR